jgi:hypothetical protein
VCVCVLCVCSLDFLEKLVCCISYPQQRAKAQSPNKNQCFGKLHERKEKKRNATQAARHSLHQLWKRRHIGPKCRESPPPKCTNIVYCGFLAQDVSPLLLSEGGLLEGSWMRQLVADMLLESTGAWGPDSIPMQLRTVEVQVVELLRGAVQG